MCEIQFFDWLRSLLLGKTVGVVVAEASAVVEYEVRMSSVKCEI
jgi:hypothetical protein